MQKLGLTGWILIAMLLGVAIGLWVHYGTNAAGIDNFSAGASAVTDIFLRLIKMIIAPLVFSTLVVGIAKLGDIKSVGRIGGKTLLWFLGATFLSLLLGLIVMNALQLGSELNLPVPSSATGVAPGGTGAISGSGAGAAIAGIDPTALSFKNFITHVFPTSIFEAMSGNLILQIVVFSVFFGIATASLGDRGHIIIKALDAVPGPGGGAGRYCIGHGGKRAGFVVHVWQVYYQFLPDYPRVMVIIAADCLDVRGQAGDRSGDRYKRHDPAGIQHGQFGSSLSQIDPGTGEFRLPAQDRQLRAAAGVFF
jgi:Sodium:dicarboxylate symporter family